MLASERALKQSAVNLCAALSGLAEDTDDFAGTPISSRALGQLVAEVDRLVSVG